MNKRTFISVVGLLCFGLSGSVKGQEQASIKDTASMSPQVAEVVKRLTEAKILEGYPDSTFRPDQPTKRNEVTVAIFRFMKNTAAYSLKAQKGTLRTLLAVFSPPNYYGYPEGQATGIDAFKDINWSNWWYQAESDTRENGLIADYPNRLFRSLRNVSRAELATLLARLAERKHDPLPFNMKGIRFADVNGDEWYFGSVLIAAGTGLMQGYSDRTFRPHGTVTRGEFAVALARLLPEK